MTRWHIIPTFLLVAVALATGCVSEPSPSVPEPTILSITPQPSVTEVGQSVETKARPVAVVERQPKHVERRLAALDGLAPDARQENLLVEARKEARVVFYVTSEIDKIRAEEKAFRKKYPFVASEFVRANATEAIQKILAESRTGRQIADVIQLPSVQFQELMKEGVFGRYLSPERGSFDEAFLDERGFWTAIDANATVLAYNKNLVQATALPKTLHDLLDSQWKNKLGRTRYGGRWLAATLKLMGNDRGLEFAQKLAQQNVTIAENSTELTHLVESGEVLVGFGVLTPGLMARIKKGAPLGIQFIDPTYFSVSVAGIARSAPHPYSAALLLDFLMSREVQESLASKNSMGGRTDVSYPWSDEMKAVKTIISYSPDIVGDEYREYQSKFESLFVNR
ncbi:MAG: extracellular solute-binding protein [Chloroflexi bacterium]|nr:extracellular solute-binding protein [Chloroflexota bacterium]